MTRTQEMISVVELAPSPSEVERQSTRNIGLLNASGALNGLRDEFFEALQQPIASKGRMAKALKVADKLSKAATPFSACKSRCSHCCHIPTTISQTEAKLLAEASGRKVARVEARYSRAETAHYFRTPCPFLKKGSCSVYSARPMACRLMFNMADTPYFCNPAIEPEDSHVTMLNLQDMHMSFTGTFLNEAFADIRDFFPALQGTTSS